MDTLFSAGFAWGDDDTVADLATRVATLPAAPRTTEKVGFPDLLHGGVATVATVADGSGQALARRLSQPPVAGVATAFATPETVDFCGAGGGALATVADVASVAAWREGVSSMTRLIDMPPPYHGRSWRALIRDARQFLDDWGADAVATAWSTLDVFGANPVVSHRRLDRLGLVSLLNGSRVQQLDAGSALIGRGRDVMTYHRRQIAAGSVPIWMMRDWQ